MNRIKLKNKLNWSIWSKKQRRLKFLKRNEVAQIFCFLQNAKAISLFSYECKNYTLLSFAIRHKHYKLVELLFKDCCDNWDYLENAIKSNDIVLVQSFLRCMDFQFIIDSFFCDALTSTPAIVECYLQYGIVNQETTFSESRRGGEYETTALLEVMKCNNPHKKSIIRMLLLYGATIPASLVECSLGNRVDFYPYQDMVKDNTCLVVFIDHVLRMSILITLVKKKVINRYLMQAICVCSALPCINIVELFCEMDKILFDV